jgi:cellulose synthase/poly-beta-1,6-N-acetylglucosamine synthase-like glycosyltransferase
MLKNDLFAKKSPVKSVSIIVPVYNEEKSIYEVLNSLYKFSQETFQIFKFQIVIVESNSTDLTKLLIKQWVNSVGVNQNFFDLEIVFQEKAQGKGNAVREALLITKSEVIVIFDGDQEYDITDLLKFIRVIEEGKSSFVLGNRHSSEKFFSIRSYPNQKKLELLLNFGHWLLAFYMSILVKQVLFDPFTMWKVYRREIFDEIALDGDMFDFHWELVIKASRLGCHFVEIPCSYKSRDFSQGKKIRIIRDPIEWIFKSIVYRFKKL